MKITRAFLAASLFAMGCNAADATKDPHPDDEVATEHPAVTEARTVLPRFAELQTKVFSGTCSPNPGVCHNASNYPNLATAGNTLTWIGAPCNVELPNPLDGWDACEPLADAIETRGAPPGWYSRISWIEQTAPGAWRAGLMSAPDQSFKSAVAFLDWDGAIVYDPPVLVSEDPEDAFAVTGELTAGVAEVIIRVETQNAGRRAFADSVLATIRGGDPNQNGILGAVDESVEPGAVVFPGSLARSYLWGRITETVPGSRMPLANTPLTLPDYVAIACWIEGLRAADAQPEDPIDYDGCSFAKSPVDYTQP